MPNPANPTNPYASFLGRAFRVLRWLAFLGATSWAPSAQAATRAVRENSIGDHSIVEYDVTSGYDIQQAFPTTSSLTQQTWQQESRVADHTIALAEISWLYLIDSHGDGMTLSADGKIAYVTNVNGLTIIDVSNKFSPTIISTFSTGVPMLEVALLDENWACVTNTFNGFLIINVTDPAEPILTARLPLSETDITFTYVLDVSTDRNTVYVSTSDATLFFIDVQNKEDPQILSRLPLGGIRLKRSLNNRYLYTVNAETLFKIIDILNPQHPTPIGSLTLADGTVQVALGSDEHTVIISQRTQTRAIDVRDPHTPVALPNPLPIIFHRMLASIEEKLGYAASPTGAYIIDLQDPKHLRVVSELNRRNEPSAAVALSPDKKNLYLGVYSGFSVAEIIRKPFLPALLTKRAVIPTMPSDGGMAEDILLTPDERIVYLRLSSPRGFSVGFIVIDVSDPSVPKRITKYSVPNTSFDHWALSENGQLLYTADHRWLQFRIVDVSIPSQPRIRGTHPISQEGKVCLISGRNTVYIIHKGAKSKEVIILDVSNPDNPTKIGDLPEAEIHSIKSSAHGERIFISGKKGLEIADITGTNITAPQIMGRYTSAGEADTFELSPDNQRVYARFTTTMSIQIIDVVDPQNMRYVAEIKPSGTGMFSELGETRLTRDGQNAYIGHIYGFGLYDVNKTPQLKAYITLPGQVKQTVPMESPYVLIAAGLKGFYSIYVQNPAPLVALPHPACEQQVITVDQPLKKQFIIYHGGTLQEATDGGFSLTTVQMSQDFEPEALPYWLTFTTLPSPSDTFPPINSRPQFSGVPIRMSEPLVIAMSAKDHNGNLLMQQLISFEIQSSLTLTVNGTSLEIASPSNVVVMTMTLSDIQAGAFISPQQGSVTADFNPKKGQFSALGSVSDLNKVLSQLRFSTVMQGNHTVEVKLDDKVNNLLTRWVPLSLFRENQSPQIKGEFQLKTATTSKLYHYKLEPFFKDPDGDPLHYYYEVAHPGAELSWLKLEKSTGVFSGIPQIGNQGKTKLTLIVSDGHKKISTDLELEVNFSASDLIIQFLTYGGFLLLVEPVVRYIYACGKFLEATCRNVKAGGGGALVKWVKASQPCCQQNELTQLLTKVRNLRAETAYHRKNPQIGFFNRHQKQESTRAEIARLLKEMHQIQDPDNIIIKGDQLLSTELAELEREFAETASLLENPDIQMVQQPSA